MNGDWYPWSVGGSNGTADDYVAAFRRVHRIFEDAGATRVEWVWCPNVIINGDADVITHSYPGDDYVDIVAVDGYNFGNERGHHWIQPSDLFGPTLELFTSIAGNKPVWINEVGCSSIGGNKAQWIADFVKFLIDTDVRGLIWFEADKPGEPDWRLTSTAETTAAAKTALAAW
jgi:beta-mannanase